MWSFIKSFLSNVFGTMIGLALFVLIGVFIIVKAASSISEKVEGVQNPIEEPGVLYLELDSPISEYAIDDPLKSIESFVEGTPASIGLLQLIKILDHAATDSNIKGLVLKMSTMQAGYAKVDEIREAIQDFKKSGKFVYAYGNVYSEKAYYLASVADSVFIQPTGMIEFNGLSVDVVYFKGLLDKLGIDTKVFKVGDYKSAVEPFIRQSMSEENRSQIERYTESIYGYMLSKIADSRGMSQQEVRTIADSMKVRLAGDAVKYKLADEALYFDEFSDLVKTKCNVDTEEKLPLYSYFRYLESMSTQPFKEDADIAVIFGEGQINSFGDESTNILGEGFSREIRKARKNKNVKAIVLRINSPGGSALASDIIWREVYLAAQEKVVIASMSDVAASGGYYISMAADTIIAKPNTITGSIGVFGLYFNIEDLMEDKLGVTSENYTTGKHSDLLNPFHPLTKGDSIIIQESVNEIYHTFLSGAAEGRNMPVDSMEMLASGRVWSGKEAKENGLVDLTGGLMFSIKTAAKAAGLEDYTVQYVPQQKPFMSKFLEKNGDNVKSHIPAEFREYYDMFLTVSTWQKNQGAMARLPFDLKIN